MRLIANNCYQLEHSKGANGYVVAGSAGAAVIDPGISSGYDGVLKELRDSEARVGRVIDLVLTHYDFDHVQVAARLQRELGARVWLGRADAAILRGDRTPPTAVRRLMQRLTSIPYPDQVEELEGTGSIFEGLDYFPTPGHTPGHFAFQWQSVLFSGDSVTVRKDGGLRQFILRPVISDRAVAGETEQLLRERIASTGIEWICAGHNRPTRTKEAG
ncbi:MBL fold metallo-hydrolase [Arthrobacter sp. Br18]|uniref:MBL fold metallo-hydrolase n=1 Tax=Arthrobacter sp. Br18 TaxID=1312954 RepID=UPI00047D9D43|nr:MBL fold metallo-hydrolase [Arthrobacter sp. Br18]